jgi:hypothetical protein
MGIINALFSYLVDFTFWQGSIFDGWLPFVEKNICRFLAPEEFKKIMQEPAPTRASSFETVVHGNSLFAKYYKILGGCIVCVNVWLGMLSWFIICHYIELFEAAYGFVYILVGNAFLRKVTGVVHN